MGRAPNLREGARPNYGNLYKVFMSIDEHTLARLARVLAAAEAGKGGRAKLAPEDAEIFKKAKMYDGSYDHHRLVEIAMDFANNVIDGHGIEVIRGEPRDTEEYYHMDTYYADVVALYVNTGGRYVHNSTTILYETQDNQFLITDAESWIDRRGRDRYRIAE